jgi:hypothetical protein
MTETAGQPFDPVQTVAARSVLKHLVYYYHKLHREYKYWYDELRQTWGVTKDPGKLKAFIERWRNGNSMWDDPPAGWNERDLAIWQIGYIDGREVECGNHYQLFRYPAARLSEVLSKAFGYRPGLPSPEEAKAHEESNLIGLWLLYIQYPQKGYGGHPQVYRITVDPKGTLCYDDGRKKKEPFTEKDRKMIRAAMPITWGGTPAAWPKLKPGQTQPPRPELTPEQFVESLAALLRPGSVHSPYVNVTDESEVAFAEGKLESLKKCRVEFHVTYEGGNFGRTYEIEPETRALHTQDFYGLRECYDDIVAEHAAQQTSGFKGCNIESLYISKSLLRVRRGKARQSCTTSPTTKDGSAKKSHRSKRKNRASAK